MENLIKEIKESSLKHGIVVEELENDVLKAYSTKYQLDEWLIVIRKTKIDLLHRNKKRKNKKCKYHLQNSYQLKNWRWAIEKINGHGEYTVTRKHYKSTDWVSDMLNKHNASLMK